MMLQGGVLLPHSETLKQNEEVNAVCEIFCSSEIFSLKAKYVCFVQIGMRLVKHCKKLAVLQYLHASLEYLPWPCLSHKIYVKTIVLSL